MSYYLHEVYCPGIKTKLLNAGVVTSRTLITKRNPQGALYEAVLDFSKCDAESWDDQLHTILAHGVVNYAQRNEDGSYGVRRDYTTAEQAQLCCYPVYFRDEDHMQWRCAWTTTDDPLYYASRVLPDDIMHMYVHGEGFDDGWFVQNGQHKADEPEIRGRDNYELAIQDAIVAFQASGMNDIAEDLKHRASNCATATEYATMLNDYIAHHT